MHAKERIQYHWNESTNTGLKMAMHKFVRRRPWMAAAGVTFSGAAALESYSNYQEENAGKLESCVLWMLLQCIRFKILWNCTVNSSNESFV